MKKFNSLLLCTCDQTRRLFFLKYQWSAAVLLFWCQCIGIEQVSSGIPKHITLMFMIKVKPGLVHNTQHLR